MNTDELVEKYKNKIILVIGASGYIGNSLLKKLQDLNIDVHGTCNHEQRKKLITCDITNYDLLKQVVDRVKPNIVFNLSGYINKEHTLDSFEKAIKINMIGLLNIIKVVNELENFERLVTIGTIDELSISSKSTDKISPYAISKYLSSSMGTYIVENFNLPISIVRTGIVYGNKQNNNMFIPSLIDSLIKNKSFDMSAGEQKRDFIYIEDFLRALLLIPISKNTLGKTIDVGYGKSYKISEVAYYIANKLGKKDLLNIGAIPYRENEIMNYNITNDGHYGNFGWNSSVDIFKGIDETLLSIYDEK